jgi:cytidine deaminase
MSPDELVNEAMEARKHAYAPYSKFAVGAALLAASGRVYRGANVENASYGLTVCAERAAISAAVVAGERNFTALAVATAPGVSMCGACRQVAREFGPDLIVHLAAADGSFRTTSLAALLPDSFGPGSLRDGT